MQDTNSPANKKKDELKTSCKFISPYVWLISKLCNDPAKDTGGAGVFITARSFSGFALILEILPARRHPGAEHVCQAEKPSPLPVPTVDCNTSSGHIATESENIS